MIKNDKNKIKTKTETETTREKMSKMPVELVSDILTCGLPAYVSGARVNY